MFVKHAKEVGRQWVIEVASKMPDFSGAFYHGSTNWLPDNAALSTNSDLDIMVVLANPNPPVKPGKFIYKNVLLEVSYLPLNQLQSPELVLSQSHLAGSFRVPSVILDPSGQLTELQRAVSKDYAKRQWIYKRCEHARDKVLQNLQGINEGEPFHDQVVPWLFGVGVTTHILLVAGLKNPTVRRRYVAVKELLAEYGYSDFYHTLLEMLGCDRMSKTQAEQHLTRLASVFDIAKTMVKTPFFFAADISDIARSIAIDGSRELIEGGYHREAVFWMVATYSRCQMILYHDAPDEISDKFSPGYRLLLNDLGITTFADIQQRSEQVKKLLPRIWDVAEAIIAANPEIED